MARLKEHSAFITGAVDFFLKHSHPVKADATIGHVIEESRAVKRKAGLSRKYLDTSIRCFFDPLRGHFKDGLIAEATAGACEKYIYGHKRWNVTSQATYDGESCWQMDQTTSASSAINASGQNRKRTSLASPRSL